VRRRVARAANPYTLRARSDAVKMQRGQHRPRRITVRVEVLLVVAGRCWSCLPSGWRSPSTARSPWCRHRLMASRCPPGVRLAAKRVRHEGARGPPPGQQRRRRSADRVAPGCQRSSIAALAASRRSWMASHSSASQLEGRHPVGNGTMIPLPGKTSWRETNPSEEYRRGRSLFRPSPEHQERHRRRRPAAVRYGPAPGRRRGGLPPPCWK